MAERSGFQETPVYEPPSYENDPYWQTDDPYHSYNSYEYGPPWPPRMGPEIPDKVRAQLRDVGDIGPSTEPDPGAVSRDD